MTNGIGHLELVIKGKTHANGDFRVKNLTGWFTRSTGDDHIRMQVKVKKPLN